MSDFGNEVKIIIVEGNVLGEIFMFVSLKRLVKYFALGRTCDEIV